MTFDTIPAWAIDARPSVYNLFSAITLSGLEGRWIRLTAATQRALIGANLFGKAALMFDGVSVRSSVTCCFGTDSHGATWTPEDVRKASTAGLKLHPAYSGPGYFAN
jgi:hypothetical protein